MSGQRFIRTRRQHRRANSIIEMAFVLNLLMWLAMGMAEFGQYFYIKNTFQAAARDIARASSLASAVSTDPTTNGTRTMAFANVTYNPSWLTILDVTTVGGPYTVITDVSSVSPGHAMQFTISTNYTLIPNVYRPLFQITGKGIGNGKMVTGQCMMIKE